MNTAPENLDHPPDDPLGLTLDEVDELEKREARGDLDDAERQALAAVHEHVAPVAAGLNAVREHLAAASVHMAAGVTESRRRHAAAATRHLLRCVPRPPRRARPRHRQARRRARATRAGPSGDEPGEPAAHAGQGRRA